MLEGADVLFKMGRCHVGLEGLGIGPCFADHEDAGVGGAFKHVVGHAACVLPRGQSQGLGGFEGRGIAALVGFKEAVETKHLFGMLNSG